MEEKVIKIDPFNVNEKIFEFARIENGDPFTTKKVINMSEYNVRLDISESEPVFEIASNTDVVRYFKGLMRGNLERFKGRVTDKLRTAWIDAGNGCEEMKVPEEFLTWMNEEFGRVEPFTYSQAFEIKNDEFRAKVFSSIDISEMIETLNGVVSKSDEIEFKDGLKLKYELVKCDGGKLDERLENEDIFVIRGWCPSTGKEFHTWVNENFTESVSKAVASLYTVPKNYVEEGLITGMVRQGDTALLALSKPELPSDERIALTPEQLLKLIEKQS